MSSSGISGSPSLTPSALAQATPAGIPIAPVVASVIAGAGFASALGGYIYYNSKKDKKSEKSATMGPDAIDRSTSKRGNATPAVIPEPQAQAQMQPQAQPQANPNANSAQGPAPQLNQPGSVAQSEGDEESESETLVTTKKVESAEEVPLRMPGAWIDDPEVEGAAPVAQPEVVEEQPVVQEPNPDPLALDMPGSWEDPTAVTLRRNELRDLSDRLQREDSELATALAERDRASEAVQHHTAAIANLQAEINRYDLSPLQSELTQAEETARGTGAQVDRMRAALAPDPQQAAPAAEGQAVVGEGPPAVAEEQPAGPGVQPIATEPQLDESVTGVPGAFNPEVRPRDEIRRLRSTFEVHNSLLATALGNQTFLAEKVARLTASVEPLRAEVAAKEEELRVAAEHNATAVRQINLADAEGADAAANDRIRAIRENIRQVQDAAAQAPVLPEAVEHQPPTNIGHVLSATGAAIRGTGTAIHSTATILHGVGTLFAWGGYRASAYVASNSYQYSTNLVSEYRDARAAEANRAAEAAREAEAVREAEATRLAEAARLDEAARTLETERQAQADRDHATAQQAIRDAAAAEEARRIAAIQAMRRAGTRAPQGLGQRAWGASHIVWSTVRNFGSDAAGRLANANIQNVFGTGAEQRQAAPDAVTGGVNVRTQDADPNAVKNDVVETVTTNDIENQTREVRTDGERGGTVVPAQAIEENVATDPERFSR